MSETKLLGILLPNIPELQEILSTIREKHNIPPVLPENVQLAETLFEERTAEEWKAIRDEIESELQVKIPLLPSNIGKIFQDLMELSSKSPELKELQDQTIKIREPEAKLMEALMKNVASGIELLDQIYETAADKLFDHLITGRPIELPAHLLVT